MKLKNELIYPCAELNLGFCKKRSNAPFVMKNKTDLRSNCLEISDMNNSIFYIKEEMWSIAESQLSNISTLSK